jgi:hypothetical protein
LITLNVRQLLRKTKDAIWRGLDALIVPVIKYFGVAEVKDRPPMRERIRQIRSNQELWDSSLMYVGAATALIGIDLATSSLGAGRGVPAAIAGIGFLLLGAWAIRVKLLTLTFFFLAAGLMLLGFTYDTLQWGYPYWTLRM